MVLEKVWPIADPQSSSFFLHNPHPGYTVPKCIPKHGVLQNDRLQIHCVIRSLLFIISINMQRKINKNWGEMAFPASS